MIDGSYDFLNNIFFSLFYFIIHTGCTENYGTGRKGVVAHDKVSRKRKATIFDIRFHFGKNR